MDAAPLVQTGNDYSLHRENSSLMCDRHAKHRYVGGKTVFFAYAIVCNAENCS